MIGLLYAVFVLCAAVFNRTHLIPYVNLSKAKKLMGGFYGNEMPRWGFVAVLVSATPFKHIV